MQISAEMIGNTNSTVHRSVDEHKSRFSHQTSVKKDLKIFIINLLMIKHEWMKTRYYSFLDLLKHHSTMLRMYFQMISPIIGRF